MKGEDEGEVDKNGIYHIEPANEEAPYQHTENKVSPKTKLAIP
jgi:hypothetical protein